MNEPNNASPFPIILAATVHDIKSSLGVLLKLMRKMAIDLAGEQSTEFSHLEFETNRINHSLMQLLIMFKIDICSFDLDIDHHSALEIINEARAQQDIFSKIKKIKFEIDCADDLMCFCDFAHISNVLGTILNNALRYTNTTVYMTAKTEDGYIVFFIEDDGQGYPENFLTADFAGVNSLDWVNGNTGLGLYFASAIAALHQNKQKHGFIKIDNQSRLGGARFRLYLP